MKKYNAETEMRGMSEKAFDYYSGCDWKVWKDESGGLWYGLGREEYGPYTLTEMENIFEAYAEEESGLLSDWDFIVELMDNEIRESVHADLAPCTDEEFLAEYCKRHEAKYGEPFCWE